MTKPEKHLGIRHWGFVILFDSCLSTCVISEKAPSPALRLGTQSAPRPIGFLL